MFSVGDKVCLAIDRNIVGVIISVISSGGSMTRYQVFHDASNIAVYYENQLTLITDEQERIMTDLQTFWGLYAARKMKINSPSTMFALNAGSIKFIPFQFRPLSRILNAERPRILIADEVGVGKTIETGIILKEFEKRDSVKSVIIICPKDLTSKWRREMKVRFDEAFEVLTSERLGYCLDECLEVRFIMMLMVKLLERAPLVFLAVQYITITNTIPLANPLPECLGALNTMTPRGDIPDLLHRVFSRISIPH